MNAKQTLIPLLIGTCSLIAGCGDSDPGSAGTQDNLSIDLSLPDSLTGGQVTSSPRLAGRGLPDELAARGGTGEPCSYQGVEQEDDLFRNGYQTTRFMVSIMASWTCIADLLIDVADVVVHDGSIVETDNDTQSASYESDEPTHYSVTDDSETQTTIRMYYGYDRANPPTENDKAEFYISWNESENGPVEGRLIVDAIGIDASGHDPEDPISMRMDFNFNDNLKTADMFLRFDENNAWADGMRIDISKDLNANSFTHVYTARGMINMKGQFFEVDGITEIPDVQFYTVADGLGNGAAIEEIQDMSLPIVPNLFRNNHLGNYLFTKRDLYFFEDDMDWDYIHKTVTAATYRGGRTTAASGGSWIPFDPSLDMIVSALSLDADYFSGNQCAVVDDDCTDLLNAIFIDGFAGQEQNQGSDPMDWRSEALQSAVYLDSVYPNGENWEGAFEQSFTPSP